MEAESAATRSRAEAEAAAKAATELEQVTLETLFRKGLTDDAAAEVFLSQLARELSPPAQRELQRLVGSKLRPSQALQLLERAGVENPKQFFEDLAKVRDPADPSIQEGAAAELPKTPVLEQDIDVIVKQRPTSWDVSLTIKARDPTRGNIEVEPTWALASAPLKGGKPTKGPSLGIFTKEALPGGTQKVKLDPEKRFSFTKKALQLVREQFRKDFGHDPETLPGSLADDNLANFRTEWIKIKLADPNISDSKAGEMAIRRISFGRARIAEGYSEFELPPQPLEMVEVRVGGKSRQIEVPKNVEVIARRPAQSGIELNTTDTE